MIEIHDELHTTQNCEIIYYRLLLHKALLEMKVQKRSFSSKTAWHTHICEKNVGQYSE